jgi:hypothetical protein
MDVVWIDKFEVARRQIVAAIRLFFEEGDPIVIHTLVASAHQVLVDIGESKGIQSVIKNAKALQGPDAKKYLASINFAFNFIKHADRDGDAKINVTPLLQLTSDFLMDAILLLQLITGKLPIEAKVFWIWFLSTHPEEFEDALPDGPIKEMQQMGIEKWDFKTIRQFLLLADVTGDVALAKTEKS